jgi:hypothetical protein
MSARWGESANRGPEADVNLAALSLRQGHLAETDSERRAKRDEQLIEIGKRSTPLQ